MTNKPSDIVARMKGAVAREKPASTVEEPSRPPTPEAAVSLPVAKSRRVRYTLDLVPEHHKALKIFAVEAEVDASEVMRALLHLLRTDAQVKNAVLTAISKPGAEEVQ